jgi:hypothetical protein
MQPGPRHAASATAMQPAHAQRVRLARGSQAMKDNFSLIMMCVFLLGSLAFLFQQISTYR